MSDETKDITEEVRSVSELAPIMEGVTKIADHVTKRDKKLKAEIDETKRHVDSRFDEFEGKVNKTVEDVIDRIERVKRASSVIGRQLLIEGGDDVLKEVISENVKQRSGLFEHAAMQMADKNEDLNVTKADYYMAAQEWFYHATRAQSRYYAGKAAFHNERAEKIFAALNDTEHKALGKLQEDTESEGGYLIPAPVEADIHRLMKDASVLWPLCRQIQMTSKTMKLPSEKTACTVGWLAEEGALTQTTPTFSQITLTAEKLYARATMSLELLQDSAPGLLAWLLMCFSEIMAGERDKQLMLSDGTTTCDFLGIINGADINVLTDSTRTSLNWGHVAKTFSGASEAAARNDGVWCVSAKGYAEVVALRDSNGMPIASFGTAARGAPPVTLLGRPLLASARWGGSATLDNTTAVTQKTKLVFGPPSTVSAGTRIGMTWDVTDQVNWANYQADARLVGRFAARVVRSEAWSYHEIKYT